MSTTVVQLRPRADQLTERLTRSAGVTGTGHWTATADIAGWLADWAGRHHFTVERIPFRAMDGWSFAPDTGNLVHRSGRFFTIEGLSVTVDDGPVRHWQQPVIRQPEVGILGILAKEFDGVLHFLMQAKMEPGNPNLVQLSPTVQATRSNYSKVHGGTAVKYLDYFTRPGRSKVLTDVLQSEHGAWFYRKSNRNMLVEAVGDVPVQDGFRWLTLGQIGELLRRDNLVNMDSRTVLACLPMGDDTDHALHSDVELRSWFTVERSRHDIEVGRIPLSDVDGWVRDDCSISRTDGRYFRLVAVSVQAEQREVSGWSQPLFEPTGLGIAAFLFRRIAGVPHVLVHARTEAGFLDTVELGPTVQCVPSNFRALPGTAQPAFLDVVSAATPDRIAYEAVHSEEGGRFLTAESRYLFVQADEAQAPLTPPPGYQWITPGQLNSLTAHAHYVNVQARSLLACLNSGAVELDPR